MNHFCHLIVCVRFLSSDLQLTQSVAVAQTQGKYHQTAEYGGTYVLECSQKTAPMSRILPIYQMADSHAQRILKDAHVYPQSI